MIKCSLQQLKVPDCGNSQQLCQWLRINHLWAFFRSLHDAVLTFLSYIFEHIDSSGARVPLLFLNFSLQLTANKLILTGASHVCTRALLLHCMSETNIVLLNCIVLLHLSESFGYKLSKHATNQKQTAHSGCANEYPIFEWMCQEKHVYSFLKTANVGVTVKHSAYSAVAICCVYFGSSLSQRRQMYCRKLVLGRRWNEKLTNKKTRRMLPSTGPLISYKSTKQLHFQVCFQNKRVSSIFFNKFCLPQCSSCILTSSLMTKQSTTTKNQTERKNRLIYKLVLCNFVIYDTELSTKFLERRPIPGVILPAAAHNPGDFHGAAVWSRHTVS